jgi:hypothetical protein
MAYKLYDDKDIAIVAQAFESIAPDSIIQRARMMVEIAKAVGVGPRTLQAAIEWERTE